MALLNKEQFLLLKNIGIFVSFLVPQWKIFCN